MHLRLQKICTSGTKRYVSFNCNESLFELRCYTSLAVKRYAFLFGRRYALLASKLIAPLALEDMHLFLSKICNSGSQMKKIDLMNMFPKKMQKHQKQMPLSDWLQWDFWITIWNLSIFWKCLKIVLGNNKEVADHVATHKNWAPLSCQSIGYGSNDQINPSKTGCGSSI